MLYLYRLGKHEYPNIESRLFRYYNFVSLQQKRTGHSILLENTTNKYSNIRMQNRENKSESIEMKLRKKFAPKVRSKVRGECYGPKSRHTKCDVVNDFGLT